MFRVVVDMFRVVVDNGVSDDYGWWPRLESRVQPLILKQVRRVLILGNSVSLADIAIYSGRRVLAASNNLSL